MESQQLGNTLMAARDALNGAINAAFKNDLFSAGAYTRNAHKILDDLMEKD